MREAEYAVEMRFLVPPHLIEAARQAMSSFTVKKIASHAIRDIPGNKPDPTKLTHQELNLLLSE
jgi:hypothetical protein